MAVSPDQQLKPVPLRSKLMHRFYEPLVLLVTLNDKWPNQRKARTSADAPEAPMQTRKDKFQNFVNKLSQFCDWECRGKTVTALAVLKSPAGIEYRFASNQRNAKELECVEKFVIGLLETLRDDFKGFSSDDMISRILHLALPYLRPRIEKYIRSLQKHINLCIEVCERERTHDDRIILAELNEIHEKLQPFLSKPDTDIFSDHCQRLFDCLQNIQNKEVDELICIRSKEGEMDECEYWNEFRHAANRLISYHRAAVCLIATRRRSPELFEDFTVSFLKSSIAIKCPLRSKVLNEGLKMKDIIGRMTSDPEELEQHRNRAEHLERLKVDAEINEEEWSRTLRPIVHAEVLILDSVMKHHDTNATKFFGDYNYIGCSKPTCRLCEHYFTSHPSDIRVRQGHPNTYANWRVPDVYAPLGSPVMKKTEAMMIKVLSKLREDVFRTLKEKVPDTKTHDSNTDPTYGVDDGTLGGHDMIEELTTVFQHTGIEDPPSPSMTVQGSSDSFPSSATEYSDEENDVDNVEGGVKL